MKTNLTPIETINMARTATPHAAPNPPAKPRSPRKLISRSRSGAFKKSLRNTKTCSDVKK